MGGKRQEEKDAQRVALNMEDIREEMSSMGSTDTIDSEKILSPPDGGWGWVIVFAAFMCAFIIDGVTNSFGVFYVKFLEYYQADRAVTALAGSLVCGCFLTFGAISGPLVARFGCRPVAFLGGLVTSAALVVCTFSPNIEVFLITYGVFAGVGLGLVYVPSMLIVNFYFDKKRGIASGIVTSGAGVGVVIMAKLSEVLLEEYGWKGAHIVIAGVALNLCVCAAMFRPLQVKVKSPEMYDDWKVVAEGVVVEKDEGQGLEYAKSIPSPALSPKAQAIRNCLFNASFMSVPVVDHQTKIQYLSEFGSKFPPYSYNKTVAGRPGCRSTEWINHAKDYGPGRLSSSMYTVSTSAATAPLRPRPTLKHPKIIHLNPLARKDIFFSGSILSLEQFKSQPDMKHYIASVTIEEKEAPYLSNEYEIPKTCIGNLCEHMDLSLFKSAVFNIFCVSSMLIQIAGFIPAFFLGNFSLVLGMESSVVSTFLACMGSCCIIGRLLSGALASWKPDQCLNIMAISLVFAGICCSCFPLCWTFTQICAVTCLFGFFIGFFPPVQPVLLVRYLGLGKLSASFGLSTGLKGIATMIGPPLAGVLLESTGTFIAPFCFGGVCLALAGGMHWFIPCVGRPVGSTEISVEDVVDRACSDGGSQTEESLMDSDEDKSHEGSQLEV